MKVGRRLYAVFVHALIPDGPLLQPEAKESLRGSESKSPAPPVGKPTPANAGAGTLNPKARRPLWAYKEGREGGGRGGSPAVTPLKGALKGSPANKALPAKAMGSRGAPGEEGGEGGVAGRNPGASGGGSTERRVRVRVMGRELMGGEYMCRRSGGGLKQIDKRRLTLNCDSRHQAIGGRMSAK